MNDLYEIQLYFTIGLAVLLVCKAFPSFIKSIGTFLVAKKLDMRFKALSFFSVIHNCYLGYMADIILRKNSKKGNCKLWLIITSIGNCIFYLVLAGIVGLLLTSTMTFFNVFNIEMLKWFLIGITILLPFFCAHMVFYYIAIYAIFKELRPKQGAIFLVFSIVFKIDVWFILACGILKKQQAEVEDYSAYL